MKLLNSFLTFTTLSWNAWDTSTKACAHLFSRNDIPSLLTKKTEAFRVDGAAIPEVSFDIGESYAGLLPISDHPNETSKLWFWFFPSTNRDGRNKVTIWFSGGKGCSSLHGMITEMGPFTWHDGTAAPVANPYTWTNLTNLIFVEQPVGTGFTQGVPNISDATGLSDQFAGFYKQFIDTFDLHGSEAYIAGESYAGMYVPYVADAFIQRRNLDYYNLKGLAINNAVVGDHIIQLQATVSPFVDYWEKLFYLNETFTEQMHAAHEACGFAEYIDKYFTYPPPQEPFKLPEQLQDKSIPCNIFGDVLKAARLVNPCFNTFVITQTCPRQFSYLGKVFEDDYQPPSPPIYFDRPDVQAAINAPVGTHWEQCTDKNVFGGANNDPDLKDMTIPPALNGVLQRVIEYTNNTFIGNGDLDFLLSTNSTMLALQNITWNGFQGFEKYPDEPFYAPYHPEYERGSLAGAGILGRWGSERGVTFYSTRLGGHELPGYTPGAGYRVMEVFLGKVANLSVVGDFTTQKGEFGNVARENSGSKVGAMRKNAAKKDEL